MSFAGNLEVLYFVAMPRSIAGLQRVIYFVCSLLLFTHDQIML